MAQDLNTLYTQITLTGATTTLDIDDLYNCYVFYNTGSLSANYTIAPSASATSNLSFSLIKTGAIDLGGFDFTIFGRTLTQQEANSDLLINIVYDTIASAWVVTLVVDNTNLPSIYEGIESQATPTSGTITFNANINKKWQQFTGSQTLIGNLTITATATTAGQEFWIVWNSVTDLNSNTLSIFGITIDAGDALSGNFTVVAKWNGSTWDAQFLNSQPGLWESTGVKSVKKLGAPSTSSGDFNTDLGNNNTLTGNYILASGDNNSVTADYSTGVGLNNTVSSIYSTAIGVNNTATATVSTSIGIDNQATADYSIAMGFNNIASGTASTAIGADNIASQYYTLATGASANAFRAGSSAHSSSNFGGSATDTTAQNSIVQCLIITTDATKTTLLLDGLAGFISIAPNSVANCYVKVTGVQQGGISGTVGDVATFDAWCTIKNISGTVSLVDSPLYMDNTGAITTSSVVRGSDAAASTWALDLTPDSTNDALLVQVTGQANKTIYWHATVYIDEIKYA
jgi:hypothetical protein